jgi:hypothetical protein
MTKIVNTGVMKTRPSQQNKTNIIPRNNSQINVSHNILNKNAFRMRTVRSTPPPQKAGCSTLVNYELPLRILNGTCFGR